MRTVGLILVLALGSLASVARAADDWRALHRPLHLPSVSSGCPTSPTRELGKWPWSVAAPVYLMNVGSAPVPGTIDISQSPFDDQGWRGQKTPWLVPASYHGPVLIRAARIGDAHSPVVLAKVYGQHLSELRFRTGESNGTRGRMQGLPGRYRMLASTAQFRAAGCYAFQVDGSSFSSVVVMRVTD
jgi:hypothetical protein